MGTFLKDITDYMTKMLENIVGITCGCSISQIDEMTI